MATSATYSTETSACRWTWSFSAPAPWSQLRTGEEGEQEKGKVKADVDDVAVRQVRRYCINSEREESRQTGLETVTFVPKPFVPEC